MGELIFGIEADPESGYTAHAHGVPIFTQADDWDQLQAEVRDAVACHFDEAERPKLIRLHVVRPSSSPL